MQRTIDVHAHILTEETMRLLAREAPSVAPKLTPIDKDFSVLEVAGTPYRPFPRGGVDLETRLADMDAGGVDMQVVSVLPQTFLYGQDSALGATVCRIQNEQLASLVSQHPDRFLAIGTLPMQAPERAVAELRHAMTVLGLRGVMIGSNIKGMNLDDPSLEPFWAEAAALGAFILIHPVNVAGMDRLKSYYLVNLIGNPLDTTIAAACLVFGGVMERHPTLKICLSHGGGFVPFQAGRFQHGWHVRSEPQKNLAVPPAASVARFYYDTILHADRALGFMIDEMGADHVLLGSDYPFDMGMMDCVAHVRALKISEADRATILGREAERLLVAGAGADAHQAARAARG